MPNVVTYCRVSSDEQAETRVPGVRARRSVERQHDRTLQPDARLTACAHVCVHPQS